MSTRAKEPNKTRVSRSRTYRCLMLRLREQWHDYHVDPPQLWKVLPGFLTGQAIEWSVYIYIKSLQHKHRPLLCSFLLDRGGDKSTFIRSLEIP